MKKLYFNLIITVLFSITSGIGVNSLAEASDIESKNTTLQMEVNHLSGKIHFQGNETTVTPARPAEFTLTRGTAVEVWIMDNNPFLFTYQNKVEKKETEDYKNLKKFGEVFSLVVKHTNKNTNESAETEISFVDDDPCPKTLQNYVKEINKKITELNGLVGKRSEIIEQTTRSDSAVKAAKEIVTGWKLDQFQEVLNANYKVLQEKMKPFPDQCFTSKLHDVIDDHKDEAKKIIANLKEFASVVHQVHSGIKLENTVETKDSRMRYEMNISVKENTTYRDSDLLSGVALSAQDAGAGTFQLHFERKSYVRYVISPGMVYSFVEDPKFEVSEDPQGNRTISRTSDDYKALSGAVMLNIIAEKLFESSFEPFLQLGASADSNNIGLLLGAGFSVFAFPKDNKDVQRTLTVSGGVIWQEVDKLKDGLHVGDSLINDSPLEIEQEMDTGFYLMLGTTF